MNQPPYQQQYAPPPAQPQKKTAAALCLIIAAVIGGILVLGFGLFIVLGIFGTRRYLEESKKAEGKATIGAIARGIVTCMEREEVTATGAAATRKELPPSAPPVPASIPAAAKYMSTPADWKADVYSCARFSMSTPQYFQYEWERTSPLTGVVHARADLDGDTKVDADLSVEVRCTASASCTVGTLVEK